MSSAFLRALSPALAANTEAVNAVGSGVREDKDRLARHSTIMGASSVNDLIELIPADYRSVLADPLHALVQLVIKLANSKSTLAKWLEHEAAGTMPAFLRGTAPQIQFTSGFSDTADGRAAKRELETVHVESQRRFLTVSIKGKKDEVTALKAETTPEHAWTTLRAIVAAHSPSILERNKLPVDTVNDAGRPDVKWEISEAAIAIRDHVMEDCVVYAMRAVSLTESSLAHKALKIKKKRDLATSARTAAGDGDVQMDDAAGLPQASIQSLVDKAVAAALKKKQPQAGPSSKRKRESGNAEAGPSQPRGGKRSKQDLIAEAKVRHGRFSSHVIASYRVPSLGPIRSRDRQASRRAPKVRPASLQTLTLPQLNPVRGQEAAAGEHKGKGRRKVSRQARTEWGSSPSGRPYGKRPWKGKGKAQLSAPRGTSRNVDTDMPVRGGPSMREGSTLHASAWGPSVDSGARGGGDGNRGGGRLGQLDLDWSSLSRTPRHRGSLTIASGVALTHNLSANLDTSGRANLVSSRTSTSSTDKTNSSGPGAFVASGDLWISNPSLMPDYLLDLPAPKAIDIILQNMSLETIRSLSYASDVHVSPGVDLPKGMSYQISVGAKYMFHEPCNKDLIRDAWVDFNKRLRWRINFLFDNINCGEQPYDPDYDVRPKSLKQAPALPQYIELGLVKGRLFAYKAMANVPDVETHRNLHKTLQPDVRSIRDFLLSNEYVITGTDKNLGIAVSRRDWIVEKSQDILNDLNNYRCLEHDEATHILNLKHSEMESIATLAKKHVDRHEGTVSDFLRSKLTLRGESYHIPHFYGIPKIHKYPVKMRPIIPCHTAVQNPAAKYVSKKLKPLIKEAATIIHGTKDLAQKLSKLSIDVNRKWYIVTGDVVAFYPNIPLAHCLDIVYNMYFEHYWNIETHADYFNQAQQQVFKRCLEVGNTNLITQFQNKIYLQLNGLAMGVADSPDLANLYGYHFEKRNKVLETPEIFYYGRYIDDCLAIVYAESEQHAVRILSDKIQFDNCTITWDCSDHHQPFLDMMLYKDADNSLQYMPYRKNGNHQERIPWLSAHPLDVKRGTFLGEMTRLATLSSKFEHYLAAMRGLVALYIRRGYPADEVHKWLYSNLTKRWNTKLDDRPTNNTTESTEVLVLKTQYNLAWNYFNSHQLGDEIFGYWREWLRRADVGDFNSEFPAPDEEDLRVSNWEARETIVGAWDLRRTNLFNSKVILSRKRTRNFLDVSNLWKKTVMENLELQALDDIVGTAAQFATIKRPYVPDVNTSVVGPRLKRSRVNPDSPDDENTIEHVARRYNSPTPGGTWASGSMTTWGRGSRM